jgi:hypothetical protein
MRCIKKSRRRIDCEIGKIWKYMRLAAVGI